MVPSVAEIFPLVSEIAFMYFPFPPTAGTSRSATAFSTAVFTALTIPLSFTSLFDVVVSEGMSAFMLLIFP